MAIILDKDEHILFEVRKHWFVLATEIFWGIIAVLAPLVVYSIGTVLPITIDVPGNETVLFLFLYSAWLLVVWMVMFAYWTEYYLDVWIITNKKLIDVEQKGLFSREIATMRLGKIQDVTSEQHGILATFMKFGDLHVQTAGSEREFMIRRVANPNELRKQLDNALARHAVPSMAAADIDGE